MVTKSEKVNSLPRLSVVLRRYGSPSQTVFLATGNERPLLANCCPLRAVANGSMTCIPKFPFL
jgi:hypothetical protein